MSYLIMQAVKLSAILNVILCNKINKCCNQVLHGISQQKLTFQKKSLLNIEY